MAQSTTRGSDKKAKKKHKNKQRDSNDGEHKTNASKLKTEEDEELLGNVKDEDGECDMDFEDDGQDIEDAEISSYLNEIGVSKYGSKDLNGAGSKKQKHNDDGDVEVKEEQAQKKGKKKKNKFKTDESETKLSSSNQSSKNKRTGKEIKGNEVKEEPETGEKKKQKKKKSSGVGKKIKDKEESPDLKALEAIISYLKISKSRSYLLLKPGESWRDEKVQTESKIGPEDEVVKEAERIAVRLLAEDSARYAKNKENAKGSEARWVKTVLVSGTLSDKVAALTLMVRESPVHNVASLDNLLSMASKKGRREAMMALDTLTDLFMTGLLPDRKLSNFYQFPVSKLRDMTSGNVDQRDKFLLCWHFEEVLKKKYSQFIKILGEMLFDTLQATKDKAIRTVYQLVTGKPEQDKALLAMMVNKLGDKNLHNKAANLIGKLMEQQPDTSGTIVKEICQLMYRPNVAHRAQYNAICLLTQVRLSRENQLASELIKIYMSFFQIYIKKQEIDSKTMSALLTGVNRAYPYAEGNKLELVGDMDDVYKLIPTVNFQTGVQALMMLFHISSADPAAASRFYCALYRKLNDPAVTSTTKQTLFLTLLYKSLKTDDADNRILAFIKRILQVYSHHSAHIICGVLIIMSQILSAKPHLLNSAIKSRIASNEPKDSKVKGRKFDDDEEERFVDLPIPEEFRNTDMYSKGKESDEVNGLPSNDNTSSEANSSRNSKSSAKSTWLHRSHKKTELSSYDPKHRNPMYCRAELECIWELEELMNHFHPTVVLYAKTLLKGEAIQYPGDPIEDYALIRFLDRFVYKNPKQPTILSNVGAKEKREVTGIRLIAVNTEKYLKQKDIPEDERFLFKYFSEKVKKNQEKVDNTEVGDDEFDAYLDKFMGGRKEDFGDMGLDFAADTAKSKNKKNGKKGTKEDSDSDDDDDDDEDENIDFGDDELTTEFEKELQGMENEEDVEFSPDEDDTLGSMMSKPGKKRKKDDISDEPPRKKGKKSRDTDLFSTAEEFSAMLEDGVESGSVSLGGSNEMINKDNAARKQIAWEEKRDQWIHNKDRRSSFKGKKKGKQFSQRGGNKGKHKPGGKKGKK